MWIQENIGLGWTYIAFVLNHSKPRAEIDVDITFFLNRAIEYLGPRREDLYVFSIELGFELFYSSIVDFHASIYRYDLILSNISNPSIMRSLSKRSKQLMAWITPWGHLVNVDALNGEFTPGIVVAYDIECELCTRTLKEWFNRSLKYIMEFKTSGKPVFINIFPEKYYPEWRRRGQLETFALSNYVLSELKKDTWRWGTQLYRF